MKHELRLVPSAKSGIDASLLALYRRMTCAGVSENDFDDLVTEAHFERHDIKKLVYLSWHARRRQERDARRSAVAGAFSSFKAPADSILRFPTLDLVAGGSNTIPSRSLLNTLTELEAGRPAVPHVMTVEDGPVVEDSARVEDEERIEDTARVEEEEPEPCGLQLSPQKQSTKSPRSPKSPRRGKKRNCPQSPEHTASRIPATVSAAKRAASREVNGEWSEAKQVTPRGSPEKLKTLLHLPSVESEQATSLFWSLRADCVNKDGSTAFSDLAYRWNTHLQANYGQASISGLPLVSPILMEQFETKVCKRQMESQSLAFAQVLSGEKMMGQRPGLVQGGGPSHGPPMIPYPHVPPQSIPSFHPPPVPPAWSYEKKGVGRGGKGTVKTCKACAKNGYPGVPFTHKHRKECAFAKMEKQKPKD